MTEKMYRLSSIEEVLGLARSTIYLRIKQGLWTGSVSLGGQAVGWPASEVEKLIASRIAGRSDQEIRELVLKLQAERKEADKP